MVCENCKSENKEGVKFCIKCGQNLETQSGGKKQVNVLEDKNVKSAQSTFIDLFKNPIECFNNCVFDLKNIKVSAIITAVVAFIAMIISLIKTIYSTVHFDYEILLDNGEMSKWYWDNLENISLFEVIGKNFLMYAGIILAITVVYYIGSLIIKKEINFSKTLGISAIAVVPAYICMLVVGPILGLMYAPLSIIASIIGIMFAFLNIYHVVNKDLKLKGNQNFYFNLTCLSILASAAYYLYVNFVISGISDSINNIFGSLGF